MSGHSAEPLQMHRTDERRRRTVILAAIEPRDVVFCFNTVDWRAAQARGMHFAQDRLAMRLTKDERVRHLLVGEPFRSALSSTARRLQGRRPTTLPHPHGAAAPLRIRRRDPTSVAALRRSYARYDRFLEREARKRGLHRPAVITANPFVAAYADLDWAGPVTFYATDNWPEAYHAEGHSAAFADAFHVIGAGERRVAAVSTPIVDALSPRGPSLVVPNGVDPDEWERNGPAPHWFSDLPSPRVVYLGTLDSRLDPALVAAAERAVGGGSVALIGAVADDAHVAPLATSRVSVRPAIPRAAVAAVLRAADASIIPHVRIGFTEAMSPLKLYEALAAGLPVVATDLGPIRGVHPAVRLASDPMSFEAGLREALASGRLSERTRRRFVDENSWSARHEAILDFALR